MKTKPEKYRNSNDNIAIGWMFGALLDTFIWNDSGIFTIAGMLLGTLLGYKQTRIGENHVG